MILLFALLGCATEETTAAALPTLTCPEGAAPKSGLGGLFRWCAAADGSPVGEWMTFHDDEHPASAGPVDGGRLGPATRMWYADGTRAMEAAPDGTIVRFDVYGKESGRTAPGTKPAVTKYPSGGVESVTALAGEEAQGRFVAYHADGRLWILGEFLGGDRHGPWLHWGKDGTLVDPDTGAAVADAGDLPPLDAASLVVDDGLRPVPAQPDVAPAAEAPPPAQP